tara:strand:- start:201 stop:419 length:219 start_codon:yes stop_codon:yes gene_type:complete
MNRFILFILFVFMGFFYSYSQCAMCRVVAESSKDAGNSIATNLNTGILYLMSFPYILLFIGLAFLYFKKQAS